MSKMGSHDSFGHLKHKLWSKERPKVKLVVWLPTIKSQQSTWFLGVQATCHIPLESSWQGLQLFFKPHHNQKVCTQSYGPPKSKESQLWEFRDSGSPGTKCHLDVAPVDSCKEYYKGEGGGFPQVHDMVNLVSPSCPWFVLAPKMPKLCINKRVVWFVQIWVSE
jgi:hypothetical protein